MNANELRIGNLVECKVFGDTYTDRFPHYGKNVFPVFSACKDFVKIDIGFDALRKVEIHEVKPIPLTEEWLESFGFKQGGYDFLFWDKYAPTGLFSISGYSEIGFGVRYNDEIDPPLLYVHQLQNLYFALTGEELTISE